MNESGYTVGMLTTKCTRCGTEQSVFMKKDERPDIVCRNCKHKYNSSDDATAKFEPMGRDGSDVFDHIR